MYPVAGVAVNVAVLCVLSEQVPLLPQFCTPDPAPPLTDPFDGVFTFSVE